MDYQKTLNLLKTSFAMRAGLVEKEPKQLERWAADDLFAQIRSKGKGKPKFILHDGPPYANGNIHIGHALNKILKDFIVKMKTMQGFDSHYIPGWDCHGLPIEHQLFKDLKKRKSDVEPVEFRRKAREFALKYVEIQKEQFKRLGVFGDWDNPYLTLTPEYGYWILNTLARLHEKGFVYRGLKPVNWCANCETALAEAEVEYEDHASPSVYVKFRVSNPGAVKDLPADKPVSLLIWTTTPWTLLANVAVAVHPGFEYAVMDEGKEVLIVEQSLYDAVSARRAAGPGAGKNLLTVKGGDLTPLTYEHPFGIKTNCRVVTADYVTREDGTGLVHIAPGHGQEDFEVGLKNKLDVRVPVNDRGIYTEDAGEFAGQHVFKANEPIIASLNSRGILYNKPDDVLPHSYPHCWRCKKPVIFRATKQWFMRIDHDGLRGRLKDAVNQSVAWIPPAGRERILGMVATRPDWCLSRQRYWGVPIPALACAGCKGEHTLLTGVIRRYAELARKEGTDVWFTREARDFVPGDAKCPDCGGNDFEKTYDILDVWFDSGVSHQAVALPRFGQPVPVDMYLEGSDQHRGWFQSSLIPAVALENTPPYRQVLTHGFVVDGQGRKMSKSMGNVISPQDEMKQHGADILRLWVASSSFNEDIRLSREILDRLVDAYRKIRNTFRYLLGNLDGFDPARDMLPVSELQPIDRWALDRLGRTLTAVRADYNRYEFARVYKTIYTFCNEDLSSFYLDILKDRLYTSPAFSHARRSAQTVLYHILDHLVRVSAPLLTFTSEEVYAAMPHPSGKPAASVHLLDWLDIPAEWTEEAVRAQFDRLMTLRPSVMRAIEDRRAAGEVGSSLEVKLRFTCGRDKEWEYLNGLKSFLPYAFIVSQVEVTRGDATGGGLAEGFEKTSVMVSKADGRKCARCWNYSVHVGEDAAHQDLCERCVKVLSELAGSGT